MGPKGDTSGREVRWLLQDEAKELTATQGKGQTFRGLASKGIADDLHGVPARRLVPALDRHFRQPFPGM